MIWRVVHISSGERGAEKIGCRIAERSPRKVHKKGYRTALQFGMGRMSLRQKSVTSGSKLM